jgi:hypothetical protein
VHHGSGPRHTDLLDPAFATGLADYAGAVAARYPWVTDWTPVNEPLTTARFAALYGFWYPHARGRCVVRARAAEPAPRDGARDAGDPPGQSECALGADRRPSARPIRPSRSPPPPTSTTSGAG